MRLRELDDLFIDTLDAMVELIDDVEGRMGENGTPKRMDATPTFLGQAFEIVQHQRHGILAAQQRWLDYLPPEQDHEASTDDAMDADTLMPGRSGTPQPRALKLRD